MRNQLCRLSPLHKRFQRSDSFRPACKLAKSRLVSPCFAVGLPSAEGRLKLPNDVAQPDFQSFCDSQKNVHCGHLVATLDLSEIDGIEINFLGKPLLRQASQLTVSPDTFSQKFSIFLRDHVIENRNRETAERTDSISYHFVLAMFCQRRRTDGEVREIECVKRSAGQSCSDVPNATGTFHNCNEHAVMG
jgi:hypothetical protein